MCNQLMGVCVCVFSGKTVDRGAVSEAAEEALELLEAFNIRSTQVPKAISALNAILMSLQCQVSTFEDLIQLIYVYVMTVCSHVNS